MKNDFVKNLVCKLIDEFELTENKKLIKKSILKEISDFTKQLVLNEITICKIVIDNLKISKKLKKSIENCGLLDSIKYCLKNRTNENNKLLKLLVQSYERVPKE